MTNNWKNMDEYQVTNYNNETDTVYLQVNTETQEYRIVNDYGNNQFTFTLQSGYEFINKLNSSMKSIVNDDIFKNDDNENENDCEGV